MTEELPVVKGMRRVRPSYDNDLKQRLRAGIHKSTDPYELGDEAANHIESCELGISQCLSRIEQLETALRNIAEGDVPRTVRTVFRDDGKPTKNDRCEHGQWMYEECGCCIEDYARTALGEKNNE
jgi:hypothetical protein